MGPHENTGLCIAKETIFTSYASDKGLIPEINKESQKLNLKGIKQMPINKWSKRDTGSQNVF